MSAEVDSDPAEIRRAIALLCQPGEVYELRALGTTKHTVSGYFDDFEVLAVNAAGCSDKLISDGRSGQRKGFAAQAVYLTLNPVSRDAFARSANAVTVYAKHTTADTEIVRRCWLLIDADPKRPAGISSTDGEHELALERARAVRDYLTTRGCPVPIFADSGNGAHLLYRIELPNDEASRDLLKRVLEALDMLFSDDAVSIDKGNFNVSRICKLYGTVARKGSNIPERPHRLARILGAPESAQAVRREQLEALAALIPEPEPRPNGGNDRARSHFDLERFISEHSIEVQRIAAWQGGRRFILAHCVFDATHGGSSAAIIQLSNSAIKYNCFHDTCSNRRWADVRELFEPGYREQHARRCTHGASVSAGGRPTIYVDSGQLRDRVKQALDAMQRCNDPPALFSRGGIMVRLRDETCELETLDPKAVLAELAEAADWLKHSNKIDLDADPPANVISAILGARRLPFPAIDSVARAPFFTRAGKLIVQSGYHVDARAYLALDGTLASQLSGQSYPENPTPADVAWACSILHELFCDFPFVDAASSAHAKALTLLPFMRLMIDGPTPNHAVNAPARGEGTGKGLLIQTACVPALGEVESSPETSDKEDIRKVLLAAVLKNAPIVWFDNIKGEVNSGVLAAILTARNWIDRILGKSKRFRGRVLTSWCIAGNGLRFSREIRRRTIMITLDANTPRAWMRTGFKHELPGWAHENRATLIRACIILVQNWIARGSPASARVLGSYENWASITGGILEASGIGGFLENRDERSEQTDREAQRWTPFVEDWWNTYATKPVTAKDLLRLADDIVADDGKSDRSRATRLGSLLLQQVGASFDVDSYRDGYLKIVRADVDRTAGRTDPGYALIPLRKTGDQVREVREPAKHAEKTVKTKENLLSNLESDHVPRFSQVRGAQVAENQRESQLSGTSPTLKGDFSDEMEIEIDAEDLG